MHYKTIVFLSFQERSTYALFCYGDMFFNDDIQILTDMSSFITILSQLDKRLFPFFSDVDSFAFFSLLE